MTDWTIDAWTQAHPMWDDLHAAMTGAGQAYYWENVEYFGRYPQTWLVTTVGGAIAGFLQFFLQPVGPDRDCPPLTQGGDELVEAKVLAFAVCEPFRRRGIGRALQHEAIDRARSLGAFQLRSYSSAGPEHAANHALKLAMGFAAQPERRSDADWGVNFIMPLRAPLQASLRDER